MGNKKFVPAIPRQDDYPRIKLYEIHEHVTAFEVCDSDVVRHFRRSKKMKLRGQVKLDV